MPLHSDGNGEEHAGRNTNVGHAVTHREEGVDESVGIQNLEYSLKFSNNLNLISY